MIVDACASVPAYSSQIVCGPSQSIHASFSHGGHGAPRCHTTFNDDTSYRVAHLGRQLRDARHHRRHDVHRLGVVAGRSAAASARRRTCRRARRGCPRAAPVTDHMNGPLWYSGPGHHDACRRASSAAAASASGSISAGAVLRISFGRPVLPPEVIALPRIETASRQRIGRRRAGRRPAAGQARRSRMVGGIDTDDQRAAARAR